LFNQVDKLTDHDKQILRELHPARENMETILSQEEHRYWSKGEHGDHTLSGEHRYWSNGIIPHFTLFLRSGGPIGRKLINITARAHRLSNTEQAGKVCYLKISITMWFSIWTQKEEVVVH